jgi:hypothetical protein
MKQKIIILILFSFIIINNCSPTRLTREKEIEIRDKEHGFIIFDFNDDIFPEKFKYDYSGKRVIRYWHCIFSINGYTYFNGIFNSQEKYRIPIHIGDNKIRYKLQVRSRMKQINYIFTSDNSIWRISPYKELKLNIKNGKEIVLKIVKVGKSEWIIGCTGFIIGIPWPYLYQEVEFEPILIDSEKNK